LPSEKITIGSDFILEIKDLHVLFPVKTSFLSRKKTYIRAVDGVNVKIVKGEMFCLVGESGSGKTTIAQTLVGLIKPTSGRLYFDGEDLTEGDNIKKKRRDIQMIFQDPYESLNPHMTVFDIVAEPLEVNNMVDSYEDKEKKVSDALTKVELNPIEFIDKYPHNLSGGQRQRVAIASTLVLKSKLIIADEPVSMLDASVRSEVLDLMINLKKKYTLTFIFITHDLAIARHIGDRTAVLYLGKIMELGNSREVTKLPLNPYTKSLVSVVPLPVPKAKRKKILLKGEIPNAVFIPSGCRFHTRCPMVKEKCKKEEPILREINTNHFSACHFAENLL
jgi:oligopeptide/dipeptide ABC transporter ATP-binding protein